MREFFKGYIETLLNPIVLVVVFFVVIVSMLTGCGSSNTTYASVPTKLTGDWHQVSNGIDDTYMTASVYAGSIQVWMRSRSDTEIYWMGTFDSSKSTKSSFKTLSLGDQDAMALSLFGSGSEKKSFQYKNGVLSFKFSFAARHKTTTVKLVKNSSTKMPSTKTPTPDTFNKAPKAKTRAVVPKKKSSVSKPKTLAKKR